MMLQKVFYDMVTFLVFYIILIVLLSLSFSVLGLGNLYIPGEFQVTYNPDLSDEIDIITLSDIPMNEYYYLNGFFLYFVATLRISMGDFSF